jgi:PAS domain S-box-containing protein
VDQPSFEGTEAVAGSAEFTLFSAMVNSSDDAIVAKTIDGVITSWNPAAERIYGYSPNEIVGQPVATLCPADRIEEISAILDTISRGERVVHLETVRLRKDGTTIPVSVTVSPIYDERGVLIGASSIARDLTSQHQLRATTDLRRAEARFRGLIDAAPDAMLCVDGCGRIILANAQTERLFGYQREELEGQFVEILVPDAVRAVHPQRRAGYMADPVPRPMGAGKQLAGRRRDGSTFPAEISLSAIETDEGILVTAAIRDVTERRRHHDDLQRANRNLETFAYSVAHDLRTPLRALAGYSAALMEECGDGIGDAGRGYAERIQAASEQMGTLIDDLLHLSRISRAEMNVRDVDLGAEAASIAAELQQDGPDRHVRFTIERPVWAVADRALLRVVLQSLLGNSWKFTSRREDASIEFGTMPTREAQVCCYVRDNGAGFDPAYTDKLFRPFQRLHTTREFAGTGVGLASVRQIVERHGGRAWAQGAVDSGATFCFTLDAKGSV